MRYGLMEQAVSVTQLNQYISTLMERDEILSYIQVRGEVSNFKRHTSGHIYFSLKDDGGVLRAVMFRSDAVRLTAPIKAGDRVIATGSIRNFVAGGQYQLYVRSMVPDGLGDLYAQFEALKNRLSLEGLFQEEHKKPIPRYPSTIGIVTSPTGAAIQDMMNIFSRRYPLVEIKLYPALVQGSGAAETVIRGIEYFNKCKPDVIIIGRGGGSIEDLWCFNDEALARAIYASDVPIISAVGHEIDFTVSDFVADLRAPTPSAAAELAVPDRNELLMRIDELATSAKLLVSQKVGLQRAKLARFEEHALVRSLSNFLKDRRTDLERIKDRFQHGMDLLYSEKRNQFAMLAEKLNERSPLAILARGYSITTMDGQRVSGVYMVDVGDTIQTTFSSGTITSVVTSIEEKKESKK